MKKLLHQEWQQQISPVDATRSEAYYFASKPDAEIWSAFQQGHEGAFTFIYDRYFDLLYNYGCKMGFTAENVEDALQDLFVDLRMKRAVLGAVSSIKPYLYKSLRRRLLRSKPRFSFFSLFQENEVGGAAFEVSVTHELPFINQQCNELQAEYLQKLLNGLPKRQKEAIFYFFYENFSYAEIADVMGLSSAKIARNLLYKSLNTLKAADEKLPAWLLT